MIASLRGVLLKKTPMFVVIECAGIGFGVNISPKDAESIGSTGTEVSLHIYTHISEGAVRLYGFRLESDLDYFSMLYGVDRVGPKTAMAIVSVLSWDAFLSAVSRKDGAPLVKVPGVGQKTAERILFELREKIPTATSAAPAIESHAIDALLSLGFDRKSAEKAVMASRGPGAPPTLESLVTAALQKLGSPAGG